MQCKNCLAPLSNGDTYCKVCGKPVETTQANQTLPSNEEVIAAYQEESVPTNFIGGQVPVEPVQPTIPVEQRENLYIQPERKMTPVQTLEQTNVMRPIEPGTTTYIPKSTSSVSPVEPVQIDLGQTPPPVHPAPAPIINETGKVDKKVFILGIVITLVATALIAILISIPVISSKVEKAKKESESNTTVPKTIVENRVFFNGYTFLIPEGFTYKIVGQEFIVEKLDTKEAMSLQIATDTYANLKEHLTTLKTNLTTAKWAVGKIYMDQNIKNRVYLFVEAKANNKNVMITYTKANDKQVFATVYLNPTVTDYPTETVETFNEIIDSAEAVKVATTTNIGTYTKNKIVFPTLK